MTTQRIFRFIISIAKTEGAGVIGAFFTTPAITTWYVTLTKPAPNPPNWIFGPVWTILYFLMGVAVFMVWSLYADAPEGDVKKGRRNALIIFDIQLALNVVWSIFFFGLHSPFLALIGIIVLWCAVVWTIILFYPISRVAAYLLVPYILWVSFAVYLNYAIFALN